MADVTQYLLDFDFDKLKTDIEGVREAYTDLGSALSSSIGNISRSFDELSNKATAVAAATSSAEGATSSSFSSANVGLGSTLKMLNQLAKNSELLSKSLMDLMKAQAGSGGLDPEIKAAKMAEISALEDSLKAHTTSSIALEKSAKATADFMEEKTEKAKQAKTLLGKLAKKEVESAKNAIGGLLSSVPGGIIGGGIIAGLLAAVVHGLKVSADQRAWMGEVRNVIEASGEALTSKESRKLTSYFSDFGWNADRLLKITKAESAALLKTYVDAGFKAGQLMEEYDKSLGRVGDNLPMVTLGLDKHFEFQTGTTARNVVQMVTDLGGSLKETSRDFVNLGFAAQRSGMGVENFTSAVMSAASQMKQYGVEVSSVGAAMSVIQNHYKKMGLGDQYSGAQAADAIQGMADAIANLPRGAKSALAQRWFPGMNAIDAMQMWEDGYRRAAQGGDTEFFARTVGYIKDLAGEGDENSKIYQLEVILEKSNFVAKHFIRLGEAIEKGGKLTEANEAELKKLANSLNTESQKVSTIERLTFKLEMAVADIGKGLLKVLLGLGGILLFGFMSIIRLGEVLISKFENWRAGTPGLALDFEDRFNDETTQQLSDLGGMVLSGIQDVWGGTGKVLDAVGGAADEDPVLRAGVAAVKKSWDWRGPKYGRVKQSELSGIMNPQTREEWLAEAESRKEAGGGEMKFETEEETWNRRYQRLAQSGASPNQLAKIAEERKAELAEKAQKEEEARAKEKERKDATRFSSEQWGGAQETVVIPNSSINGLVQDNQVKTVQ